MGFDCPENTGTEIVPLPGAALLSIGLVVREETGGAGIEFLETEVAGGLDVGFDFPAEGALHVRQFRATRQVPDLVRTGLQVAEFLLGELVVQRGWKKHDIRHPAADGGEESADNAKAGRGRKGRRPEWEERKPRRK